MRLFFAISSTAVMVVVFQNCSNDTPSGQAGAASQSSHSLYNPEIVIESAPSDVKIYSGSPLRMEVQASSQSPNPLTYSWSKDGNPVGAGMPLLEIGVTSAQDAGLYECMVSNGELAVTVGARAIVSAIPVVQISTQPKALTLDVSGTGGSLSVVATGSDGGALSYQWYKNGAVLNGATEANLKFAPVLPALAGSYHVVIKSKSGVAADAVSNIVKLTVTGTYGIAANSCQGYRCYGGVDDDKNGNGVNTSHRLCSEKGFKSAISYLIGDQEDDRFCYFNPTANAYACIADCDDCNRITRVSCSL